MPTSPTWEDTIDDSPSWEDTEAEESAPQQSPNVGEILAAEQPTLPPPVSSTGIPEIPESISPLADWTQRQREESFVPSMKDIQLEAPGIPSLMGITPESVPSGRRIAESPLGGVGFGLTGLIAPELPATVASSVGKTAIGVGEYLSSPQGIVELVGSMTPAKLAVLAKWAYDMSKGAYTEASEFGKLLAKENKTPEDRQKLSDHAVNALAMGLGAGGVVKHGVKDARKLAQNLNTPEGKFKVQDRGEVLQQMFNEYEARRQAEAGSPFTLLEPPTSPVSMEMRTQPALSRTIQPEIPAPGGIPMKGVPASPAQPSRVLPTFEPSGLGRPEVNQMRPISPGLGEEITAPSVETVRAQRELEARQKGQDAIQQKAEGAVRDVRQPEIPQEGAGQVPAREGSAQAPEALTPSSAAIRDIDTGEIWHGEPVHGLLYDKIPNLKSRNLEAGFATRDGRFIDEAQSEKLTGMASGEELFRFSAEEVKDVFTSRKEVASYDTDLTPEQRTQRIKELSEAEKRAIEWKKNQAKAAEARVEPTPEQIIKPQKGERLVELVSPDGSVEIVAFGDKYYDFGPGKRYPSIARIKDGGWSHGAAKNGEVIREIGETSQKGGEPVEKAKEEKPVLEPEVEGVTALDPQSGTPLSATESLINRLEALKYSKQGLAPKLYTLDPKIIQRVGKQLWNDAISTAQFAIRAGKTIAEAIDAALAHIRKTRSGIDEAPMRAELQKILGPETPAERPAAATPQPVPESAREVVDPVTGEPAKLITEKAAKAMESKVKLPAETDVKKLAEQIDLFNKEIGDALESGGQFLPKELRPDVAKGAPAEKGTVTNKAINQYFVNKLSSIRKQMQATKQKIIQQADIESQAYFDTLQKRFETAFRQVQELRRASHEALYFWNKIRAEYQDIARAAGAMPEMKRQLPVLDQIWKDFRDGQPGQAGRHFVDYLRMNLFTPGSWTLDFGTNLIASIARIPAWGIMDLGAMATGRAPTRMFSAIRALQNGMRNWNPLGKRYRLPDKIEAELGMTASGEFSGRGREVLVDFSEILKGSPEAADKLRHIDKLIAAPVRMKRAVDSFFGRFGAAAELYNRAYIEAKSRGLKGDELKTFVEEFVQNPSEAAVERAVRTGKELKFNRDLTKWEEAFAGNIFTKLIVEAFPRWTLQFIRWGGEMIGADPVFFKNLVTGKATPEQAVNYLTKAATGWGGIYAFNQLLYDNVDANSMEYVKEDGNRVRLSGRTPAPELFFVSALLRGDTEKAKAALKHLSLPGAKLLSGEPAGILSPLIDTIRQSIEGRYTAEQTVRELTKLVNDAIPGKSVLGLIRSIYDPTIREGIGAPIPGVASLLPQRVNPTTGEPLAPATRIPGTRIELPTVGGTPFPGAERVLNEVESALLDHGLGLTRPRRTSIIDLPAEDVPKPVRKEYEQMVGRNVKELVGEEIKSPDFWKESTDIRREILSQLLSEARSMARDDLADKYGTSGEPVKSVPLNVQRLPKRFR